MWFNLLYHAVDAQFASNISASEIATYVNSVALSELKESTHVISEACQDPVVVLLPSATYAGKIFRADERPIQYASGNNIDLNLVRFVFLKTACFSPLKLPRPVLIERD